jgi:outer membrane protein assembly factor BamD (BamD/ComL family)
VKAQAEVERRGKKKAAKKFESIVKKFPNTKAGERASKFLRSL